MSYRLDSNCHVAAWPGSGVVNDLNDIYGEAIEKDIAVYNDIVQPNTLGEQIRDCLQAVCSALISNEVLLNELDRMTGDGDTGSTFTRGAQAIKRRLNDEVRLPVNTPSVLFMELSKEVEAAMGGSSGALLGICFATISAQLPAEGCNMSLLVKALEAGINAMKRYGGAMEGDSTMLDALLPCLRSFEKSITQERSIKNMLESAAKASRSGADSTVTMVAKAGRASYVTGVQTKRNDPGAEAVAIVFEAISVTVLS